MGFSPSPYLVTKDLMVVEQMIRGNRRSQVNIFCWKKIILNLPGSISYDSSMPWVYKKGWNNKIAADLFFYIYDGKPTADTAKYSWRATQRVYQMLGYLGIQDACRKRTAPSREPGELAGTSVDLSNLSVTVFVSVKKWLRSKEIILRITEELGEGIHIDFKELEKDRGFLVYISRTYRVMVPYLKGIHQTLDSWRTGRSKDGYRLCLFW